MARMPHTVRRRGRSTAKQASPWPQACRCEARTISQKEIRESVAVGGREERHHQFAKARRGAMNARSLQLIGIHAVRSSRNKCCLLLHCAPQVFVSLSRPGAIIYKYMPVDRPSLHGHSILHLPSTSPLALCHDEPRPSRPSAISLHRLAVYRGTGNGRGPMG
ncbi:hypothetical protein GGI43DRAFT_221262 [Trichoderma evansii]